jgi:hypothetical protein
MEKNKDTIDEMCVFSKDLSWDQLREFMNDRDNRYNSEYIKRMEINEDIHLYTGVSKMRRKPPPDWARVYGAFC